MRLQIQAFFHSTTKPHAAYAKAFRCMLDCSVRSKYWLPKRKGVLQMCLTGRQQQQPSLASDTAQTVPREITLTLADIGRLLGGEEFDDDPNEWYCDYWETWVQDPGLRTMSEQAKKDIAALKKDKVYLGMYILRACVLAVNFFDIVPSISSASGACKRGRYRRVSVRPR
jgi:hypothetical protein